MRLKAITFLTTLVLLACVAPLGAGVVYSNFGPGDSYITGTGWTIGYPGSDYDQGPAFTPGSSFTLGQIDFAGSLQSGTNQIELWLMSDNGGVPGSVIESYSFVGAMGPFGNANPPLTAISTLHPVLMAGTQYWLIASAPVTDTWAVWNYNDQLVTGLVANRQFNGEWATGTGTLPVFRIQDAGADVPEPGTFLLLLAGLGLLVPKRLFSR